MDEVTIEIECQWCEKYQTFKVKKIDWQEYQNRASRKLIQDIFPYLSNEQREMFISHTCEKCWKEMMKDE